jgi:hypothetical protein
VKRDAESRRGCAMKSVRHSLFSKVPRVVCLLQVLVFLAVSPVQGQLNLNGGATYAETLGGQWGIEARIAVYPYGLPADFFAGADYFFTDCEEDCGLWGARVGGHLSLSDTRLSPFLSGAFVRRSWESGARNRTPTGWSAGAGFRLVVWKVRIQAELSREFLGEKLDQWVIRLGTG